MFVRTDMYRLFLSVHFLLVVLENLNFLAQDQCENWSNVVLLVENGANISFPCSLLLPICARLSPITASLEDNPFVLVRDTFRVVFTAPFRVSVLALHQ